MKILWDLKQGSTEWAEARRGIPTASEFDALVSAKGAVRKGEGRQTYILRKLAERLVGYTAVEGGFGGSFFMQQGQLKERYALPWLEFHLGKFVEVPGFCLSDDGRVGCSPDGIIKGEEIGVEFKSPDSHTHLAYLLSDTVPDDYVAQVQGSMFVTGFPFWYFVSWHSQLPPLCIKVARDEAYQAALKEALDGFYRDFDAGRARLEKLIGKPAPKAAAESAA